MLPVLLQASTVLITCHKHCSSAIRTEWVSDTSDICTVHVLLPQQPALFHPADAVGVCPPCSAEPLLMVLSGLHQQLPASAAQ